MNTANALGAARPGRANIAPLTSRLLIFSSVLLAAEVALELAHIFYLQVITFHPLPHLDEWRTFMLFSRMEQDSSPWSLLLVPHAEHRPLLARLVFLLDTKVAQGTGALSLAAIDCVLLGLIGIWIALLTGKASRNERAQLVGPYVLALCIAALLLSGHQMSNFIRGFQVTVFLVYFFATLSFAAFALALPKPTNGRPARPLLLIFLSCLSGICAAFSVGNGLVVLPLLLVMACMRRRERPAGAILIIGVTAAATFGAYFNAPGSILGRADYQLSPNRVGELTSYFLQFLGGPWASIAPNGTIIAGSVTLLLSAGAAIRYFRRDRLCSYELASAGLMVLALASAALSALARLRFGLEGATESRYSTTVLMLYAALLVSFWPKVQVEVEPAGPTRTNPRQTASLALLVVGTLAYGVASHWKLPYDYSEFRNVKADAEVAYVANVQDPLPFSRVVPQPHLELAWQARGYVLRHNLSVFSTVAAQSLGRSLNDVFSVSDGGCIGHLDQVERIIAGPNGGFRVAGWAWDSHDHSVPATAVLVENGIVKGIGRFIAARPDVISAVPEARRLRTGFVAYVPRGTATVTAYVLDRTQTSACPIPGELALPPA